MNRRIGVVARESAAYARKLMRGYAPTPLCRARHHRVGAQVSREADLGAGKAPRTTQAVAADLFGIARAVDTLVADGREELGLQREREDVVDAALARQVLDGANDRSAESLAVRVPGDGDRRHLGYAGRIFLERAAG